MVNQLEKQIHEPLRKDGNGRKDSAVQTNDSSPGVLSEDRAIVVRAANLTRTYKIGPVQVTGIDGIDLAIPTGGLVVIKGESGSGKSTLLSLLGGLDHPTAGTLTVAGHDLSRGEETELTEFRRNVVGMVFQTFNLLPTLDVLENVCLPALLSGRSYSAVRRRAEELLVWLEMGGRRAHLPHQLSGGEMQRTAIARALINDPAVVLADEPTGNLDSRNARKVIDLLADLNRNFKRTVIIATHSNLADVHATMMLKLQDGRLRE